MKSLEEHVASTLQKKVREAHKQYTDVDEAGSDRKVWVLRHLSQAVAVVAQITWTAGTEAALDDLGDDPFAVEDHLDLIKQQLAQLTELIRGHLTANQRRTLVALITQDVHARDMVEELWQGNVQSPFDFLWQRQLRYYLEEEMVYVRQANA
jgi:dynein heavy chain